MKPCFLTSHRDLDIKTYMNMVMSVLVDICSSNCFFLSFPSSLLSLVQMLAFFQTVFTFYHQGYELAKDFDHYKKALQINIQNVSKNFHNVFDFNS